MPHHPGRGGSADLAPVFHLHAGDQRRKPSDLCAPGADYGKTDPAGRRAHRHIPDPGGQPGQRLYPHGEPTEPVYLLPLPPYHRVFLFRAGAPVRNSGPVAGLAGPRPAEAGHTDGRAGSNRGKPVPGSHFRSAAAAVLCLGAAPAGPLGMHGHCGGGGGGDGPAPADAGRLFPAGDLYGVLHLYRQPVALGHGAAAAPVFAGDPGHCVSGRAFVQPVYQQRAGGHAAGRLHPKRPGTAVGRGRGRPGHPDRLYGQRNILQAVRRRLSPPGHGLAADVSVLQPVRTDRDRGPGVLADGTVRENL